MNVSSTARIARLAIAAILAVAVIGTAVALTGCGTTSTPQTNDTATPPTDQGTTTEPAPEDSGATTPEGEKTEDVTELKIEDVKVGKGKAAKAGDTIVVNYTGYLTDGTKFDSSVDSGVPFEFQLGSGMVIPGWDEGLVGMKVGGQRKLTIPPDMAYGAQGSPPVIPPNATLVFDVEMLEIK